MNISREEKKREAVERMRIIGIFPETIRQFEEEGLISESLPPVGACYWISEDQKARVKAFEEEHNALVYHVMHGKYSFGGGDIMEFETYLYVCDFREEWELDREDLSDPDQLQALCYVNNLTAPAFSEFGAVGFKLGPAAGLLRTF